MNNVQPTFALTNRAAFINKVFFFFGIALLIAAAGVWGGMLLIPLYPALFGSSIFMIGVFILLLGMSLSVHSWQRMGPLSYLVFALFAALSGFSLAPLLMFAGAQGGLLLILKALLATTFTFSAAALWGWITKKDLSSLGGILFVAVIGIILTSLLNMFLRTTILELIASVVGIIVFTLYTAYDIQGIKSRYPDDMFLAAAMSLYLDFINLFTSILRFFLAGRE